VTMHLNIVMVSVAILLADYDSRIYSDMPF